jgi:DNA-binding XRE family transcriptional regulator
MSPDLTTSRPLQETPYMFQRLERVKERLYTDALQYSLDAPQRAWYLRTTAEYLAEHLLETYRRRVEEASHATGLDTLASPIRPYLTVTTNPYGHTTVQLDLDTSTTERVITLLAKSLGTSDQDPTWEKLARRLAIDLSTWGLEQLGYEVGAEAIAAMSEDAFDTALLTYAWPADPTPLQDRVHHFLTLTAQRAAFDIATTIATRAPTLEVLEHLLGFRQIAPSTASLQPLLREEHLTVLSAAHYQAVREALAKNTFQHLDGFPWPTALVATGPARGHAQLRPVLFDTQPLMPPEEVEAWAQRMWRQREELSDLDADALDILSALWLYQARTPHDDAVADVTDLLAMRGLQAKRSGQGRRGGYEPEQRMAMLQAMSHIQNLWLTMTSIEVYEERSIPLGARRRKPTQQAIQSRAFTITDLFGQIRLDGGLDVEKFIFRPGKVLAHFLFGPGRQSAMLSAKALAYDPYRQKWEKRLARYLSYQWRCRAHNGDYLQPFRVVTLLDATGAELDRRDPARTRTRLEKALDTLLQDRVIAAWQYDRWEESLVTRRGWAPHWLQATILIEPPESIRVTYQRLTRYEAPARPALPVPTSLGERLKRHRKALGLTQLQAAEQLGISPSYLNRLEQGNRGKKPSPGVQRAIDTWLGAHPVPQTPGETPLLS